MTKNSKYLAVSLTLAVFAVCAAQAVQGSASLQSGASIKYRDSCGFAKGGSVAYVVNDHKDRSVKVTIRKKWSSGIKSGQSDSVYALSAGMEQSMGCTKSDNIPVHDYSYSVVGVEGAP